MKVVVYASWGWSSARTWEDVHYLTSYLARNSQERQAGGEHAVLLLVKCSA